MTDPGAVPCVMDSEDEGITEPTITMDQIAAVAREHGPEAGLQALLLAAGAGLNPERRCP